MKVPAAILIIIFLPLLIFPQQEDTVAQTAKEQALDIYLDCGFCDLDYIKSNFTLVNYVNDYHDADVNIMVHPVPAGGGGTAYHLMLLGQDKYKFMNDTLVVNIPGNSTHEEVRSALLDKIQLGLVPYLLKTPYSDKLILMIDDTPVQAQLKDPWKSWVFDISASGTYYSEKFSKNYSVAGNIFISKVTPGIKIESINSFILNEYEYRFSEDAPPYSLSQRDLISENKFVKSLGDHFGVGGLADFARSRYGNLGFQMKVGPAVEYNVFKYEEAATKQFRIMYKLMYEHARYDTLTINHRFFDDLLQHNLEIHFTNFKPWGSFSARAYGSVYQNNQSEYSCGASTIMSIRVFKGLSFNVSGGVEYCRDQRSLRQQPADDVEYIKELVELEQGLSYGIYFTISYRFGSKHNNSVNARFGF